MQSLRSLPRDGIKAQPSYKLLPELGAVPPPDIETTVRNAGVDAVLVSRTARVSTDIRVTPGHSYGPAGFYGMWGGAFSTAPNIYTVQNVEVESRLFDVKDLTLLWSGSSTTNPTSSDATNHHPVRNRAHQGSGGCEGDRLKRDVSEGNPNPHCGASKA